MSLGKLMVLIFSLAVVSLWGQEKAAEEKEVDKRVHRWMEALESNIEMEASRVDSLNAILSDFARQMYAYRQAEQELKLAMMKMRDQKVQQLLSAKQYAQYQKTMSDLQKEEFARKQHERQMEQMEEQRRQQNLEPNFNRGNRYNNRRRRF